MKRETYKKFAFKTKGGLAGVIQAPKRYTEAYAVKHCTEWLNEEVRACLMDDEVIKVVGLFCFK